MKTIYVEFYVETNRLGSTCRDVVEIEVDEDASDLETEQEIEDYLKDWVWNNIDTGFKIINK